MTDNSHIMLSNSHETQQIRDKCSSKRVRKETEKVRAWKKELEKRENAWRKLHPEYDSSSKFRWSPFLDFSSQLASSDKRMATKNPAERIRIVNEDWRQLEVEDRTSYIENCPAKYRLPVTSTYPSNRYLGAISESLDNAMQSYLKKNSNRLGHLTENEFKDLFYLKCIQSTITPGDSVGILAAQSIGKTI